MVIGMFIVVAGFGLILWFLVAHTLPVLRRGLEGDLQLRAQMVKT